MLHTAVLDVRLTVMRLKTITVLFGLSWLFLINFCHSTSQHCDNGKTKLETDLPPSDEFMCSESWPHSTPRFSDISTKYTLQPAEHICMNMTIKYSQSIPNSGAHRPVGAVSGEYLYCPPQRWINNLKDGAIVLLYHPCTSDDARRGLIAVAQSCLPHYIITAHPQLSQHRPFALVSWGHTLEFSHVTSAGICKWLLTASSSLNQTKESQRPKYSLYLTKAAPVDRVLGTTVKSLRTCCEEVLSEFERMAVRTRKRRAVLQNRKGEVRENDEERLSEYPAHNSSESTKLNITQTQPLNITEHKERLTMSSLDGNITLHIHNTVDLKNHDGEVVKTDQRISPKETKTTKMPLKSHTRGQTVHQRVVQISETEVKSHKKIDFGKHRIKTDTEEQGGRGGCRSTGQCGPPDTLAPVLGGPLQGHKMPTPRTDEAVWAAAALGFLLVLLTLSVLHTRLYRNWRTPPSLYWHETQQDYESVADIIRRRLRMVGRRKRRASQSRRQECPLLPDSSTDNESD